MKLQEEYERARAIPNFRQDFLDAIDLGDYAPYVSKVKYVHCKDIGEFFVKNSQGMVNLSVNPLQLFGVRGIQSPILVDQRLFLKIENLHDFLGYLLHHEGDHARQRFERGRLERAKRKFFEALAWANQLRNMDWGNCSYEYQNLVQAEFLLRAKYL